MLPEAKKAFYRLGLKSKSVYILPPGVDLAPTVKLLRVLFPLKLDAVKFVDLEGTAVTLRWKLLNWYLLLSSFVSAAVSAKGDETIVLICEQALKGNNLWPWVTELVLVGLWLVIF